jgi:hypothetical protein
MLPPTLPQAACMKLYFVTDFPISSFTIRIALLLVEMYTAVCDAVSLCLSWKGGREAGFRCTSIFPMYYLK